MTEKICSTNIWRRICSTLALIALGASVVVAIGLPAAGVFTGGTIRANFAVALIVISVIIDVAVLAAYSASVRIQQIANVAWLTVAMVSLVISQYILKLDYSDSPRAADSLLGIVMYLLAFPAGNIAVGLLIVLDQFGPSHANSDWWDLVIYWTVFFATGYLQWFKLLPWLIEKWRAHRLQTLDDNQKVV